MTFAQLVQSKLPTRYLGARIRAARPLMNGDVIAVSVEGMPEPLFVSGMELCANGVQLHARHSGLKCLCGSPSCPNPASEGDP